MAATTIIAIYAGLVSTAAIGWQIFAWWRTNRTRLDVYLGADLAGGQVAAARVVVVNLSPFEVTIERVFLHSFGDREGLWLVEPGEQGLPLTISARKRAEFQISIPEGQLPSAVPVVARVWTATSDEFLSQRRSLEGPPG